ncbi:capsid maturation protease UL26 [Leporid alphaherpesvirus 4]|uniref:Capsid scaffolding protein n=1 Tax=Leporid alphaherpesvirus 4 TaxID=481315 RepID=J9QYN0_9ALPH|nr:capsid maturation protease UL26 [Leporid alphaherpesvirus 4]AFR32468.1 capsid maturation protease UL26 [Leporid alphaherpesvirus 4]
MYEGGDGGELALPREAVSAALPLNEPVPINVDHRAGCEVGRVLTIVDDRRGPFFVGLIACSQLEKVLEEAASAELFDRQGPPPTREERILYLITNYLPSVSLSSRRLEAGGEPRRGLFRHVALCAIGRRVGTIVTYDVSVSGAIAPFQHLSESSRADAARDAEAAALLLSGREWAPGTDALARTLLSTAINSMMLRDRWSLVSERRRQAGIAGHTYLQASKAFGILKDRPEPRGEYKESARGAPAAVVLDGHIGHTASLPQILITPASPPMNNTPPAAVPPRTPGDTSYLWIPAAHYNQLLSAQQPPPQQQPPAPPSHGPQLQQVAVPGAYPPHAYVPPAAYAPPLYAAPFYGPGTSGPATSPLEAQLAALVGAIAADRQASDPRAIKAGKRRRHEYDEDTPAPRYRDSPYYPGEFSPTRAEPARPRAPTADDTITALMGAVSSLQQEVAHLRNQAPLCAPPAAACLAQTAAPAVPSNGQQQQPAAPAPRPAAAPEAPPAIDASCVARLDPESRRAADLFVVQMMGGRQ